MNQATLPGDLPMGKRCPRCGALQSQSVVECELCTWRFASETAEEPETARETAPPEVNADTWNWSFLDYTLAVISFPATGFVQFISLFSLVSAKLVSFLVIPTSA